MLFQIGDSHPLRLGRRKAGWKRTFVHLGSIWRNDINVGKAVSTIVADDGKCLSIDRDLILDGEIRYAAAFGHESDAEPILVRDSERAVLLRWHATALPSAARHYCLCVIR